MSHIDNLNIDNLNMDLMIENDKMNKTITQQFIEITKLYELKEENERLRSEIQLLTWVNNNHLRSSHLQCESFRKRLSRWVKVVKDAGLKSPETNDYIQ